ncbi:MAG TPA: HDOD domain-containing protein [Syntrophobacteraceae bacterium]|nr:HDOD domain-containing protein [Syntrophobacteraceae bacterium]
MLQKGQTPDRTPPGFFSNLGDKERITLFNAGAIRTLAENELLFKKGTTGKTIFCVLSGTLKAASGYLDASAFRFKAGDLIAETALSEGKGRIPSVVAEEASTVFALDTAAVDTLAVETRTAILKTLHDAMLSRMETLDEQNESTQLRVAALTRYIRESRKHLEEYENSEIIATILKSIPRLPPHIAQLVELLAGQRASAKEVAALAKQDPSLAAEILKAINSPRYALRHEITDVSDAITHMGLNEVYQIALSRGLMKSIPGSDDFRDIYRHSVFISHIAFELCQSFDRNGAALLGTIGILHDIGKTVLLLLVKQNPKWSLFIGMLDPSRLGAMLLKHWNIPEPVCQTVDYQAWPAFCPPAEIPSDHNDNIALLYIAHAVQDHLDNKPGDVLDHPFLSDYLSLIGFVSFGIDEISRDFILHGLRAKSQKLPDFVRKRISV